ncbi:MAG: phosphoenolpyruvate synthase [Candidatus Komeilibacteria bacterium]
MKRRRAPFILWFKQTSIKDIPLVGGKNASLGEMYRYLTPKGVKVPNGFSITAQAYDYFLDKAGVRSEIKKILRGLDTGNMTNLQQRGKAVRDVILRSDLPKDLEVAIVKGYHELSREFKAENVDVAVRSSATAEDLPDASFAGQQETYLNIRGEKDLLIAVRKCMSSLFTDRAISYRADKKFNQFGVSLSVTVQKMVRSDKAGSGVMFSIDTESGFQDAVLINSVWGLGEYIVQGYVTPDEYYVYSQTLEQGYEPIIGKTLGSKKRKLIYGPGGRDTIGVPVKPADRNRFVLTDKEVLKLARWAMIVEKHYKKPMDMEWAKDGNTGELFIVQARPETVKSRMDVSVLEHYKLLQTGRVLCAGASVGEKIAVGKISLIKNVKEINKFKAGDILVTQMTDPDWEPIMKKAAGIVTDSGGRTCHAAIVSRELGIPCIVGTKNSTLKLKQGQSVTVSCAEGERGLIYAGILKFVINKTNLKHFQLPKSPKVMMIVGDPEQAFVESFIPNHGVGLAREELIIANSIKIHPLALVHFNRLKDEQAKEQIEKLTAGYSSKTQYYVEKLSQGVGKLAAAFYPKDVIIRLSDFRSNEFAELIGGKEFEPLERNPMIGWRGASRYYTDKFLPAFKLELKALKLVREKMGLKNLKIMVPFCRTIEEGKKVQAIMKSEGLVRGKDGLEIYVMVEIPSNVILAKEFAKIFDGFSIGSNDLTQLTLGVDRDSELVASVYDENNEAVKSLIRQVIRSAKETKTKIGLCGQAPSDFPEFAKFLMKEKIDSISLNPDTVIKTALFLKKSKR